MFADCVNHTGQEYVRCLFYEAAPQFPTKHEHSDAWEDLESGAPNILHCIIIGSCLGILTRRYKSGLVRLDL